MKKHLFLTLGVLALLLSALLIAVPAIAGGFTHAPVIEVDGEAYYLAGMPDGPGGASDIPGHQWVQAGPNQLVGKHYNTGPFPPMNSSWWSSDAPDGELLYMVHAVIDTWSSVKAASYASQGYVHYHELVRVSDGELHPTKVLWLKHTARTSFTLDGGPRPEMGHEVTPGVDYEFINNWDMSYPRP
jgi:selenium-binding protein 1